MEGVESKTNGHGHSRKGWSKAIFIAL